MSMIGNHLNTNVRIVIRDSGTSIMSCCKVVVVSLQTHRTKGSDFGSQDWGEESSERVRSTASRWGTPQLSRKQASGGLADIVNDGTLAYLLWLRRVVVLIRHAWGGLTLSPQVSGIWVTKSRRVDAHQAHANLNGDSSFLKSKVLPLSSKSVS